MDAAEWYLAGLLRFLRVVGQLALAFMVVTVCYDAGMRYLFAAPTAWSLEINSFLIVYLAVMTAADIQREESHIHIGLLVQRLPRQGRRLAAVLTGAAGVIFSSVLAWRGGLLAYQAYVHGERMSSALGTPMVYPYAILPVGFGCLALVFLLQVIAQLRGSPAAPENGSAAK